MPQAATPGPEVAALGQLRVLQPAHDEEQASGDQAAAEHEAGGGRYTEEQVARTIFVGNVPVHRGQQRAKSAVKAALRGCESGASAIKRSFGRDASCGVVAKVT